MLHVQKLYSRVLVVDGSDQSPQRIRVGALDLNARDNDEAAPIRVYKVYALYKTLQEAADASQGGDLIAVIPGRYSGFVVGDKPSAARWALHSLQSDGRARRCRDRSALPHS